MKLRADAVVRKNEDLYLSQVSPGYLVEKERRLAEARLAA
jgi:hypothetical protein